MEEQPAPKPRRRTTPDEAADWVRMYTQDKMTIQEIADETGRTYGAVRLALHRNRVVFRHTGARTPPPAPAPPPAPQATRVIDHLRNAIIHGDYLPGDRVPAPAALGKVYRASTDEARRAVRTLIEEGLLINVAGGRTLVTPKAAAMSSPPERVIHHVREGIRCGRYAPGRPLPDMFGLAAQLGVRPVEVQQGLRALVRNEILTAYPHSVVKQKWDT